MRRIIGHSLLLLLVWAAGCNRATAPAPDGSDPAVGLLSIATLKARCSTAARTIVREELAVQGVVTANDRYGEYRRQLVIEDRSGGLLIDLEAEELCLRYPIGTLVTLFCNGLTLTNDDGRFEVMADPDHPFGERGIPADAIAGRLRIEAAAAEAPRPAVRRLDELGAETLDTFVCVEGVRFTDRSIGWCRQDPRTEEFLPTRHPIADREGHTFTVRALGSVSYRLDPLPEGEGRLCGIVERSGGSYALRVTDRGLYFGD